MKLGLKLLKARDVVVKGRQRERTPLLVLLKSWVAKKPLKRPLPSIAYIHVPSRVHHVTDRCNPWSSRGREIRGIVEVGFGLWGAWLACAFTLDLDALDPVRKKAFATKEELVIVAALVLA
jgi:hypothetical protein